MRHQFAHSKEGDVDSFGKLLATAFAANHAVVVLRFQYCVAQENDLQGTPLRDAASH